MASYNPTMQGSLPHQAAYAAPVAIPPAPVGTFAPGTKIQVGNHKVVIQKYFSEGGFAHVYLVKMPKPIDGTDIAVLKRVAVPDKDSLANMRTEVETMKKLKGHRPIVTYYDSHASQLKGGGYEVFLLMEFCNGGGLIDFMNTRLQNRLTEPEILKIFTDVAEGVACMHYLKPPLLHRDLKVENVLINKTGNSKRFKLCDFGSTAPPRPAATTATECRLIEDDVQKHTTLQYRSPEMIDVYRKQPIDEKSDIWALGVLLYKLCYYTTPFEEQGQLAILNASFKFPAYPAFSDKLKRLIASMLKENPQARPNIYQVLREGCLMQGIEVPIRDIYAARTESERRRNQKLPSPASPIASPPTVGAVYAPPIQQKTVIPDIAPMRRGRPATTSQNHAANPSPSPLRGANSDPFAALDAKASKATPGTADELASRFPSLDQFALLHDQGGKFEFSNTSPTVASKPKDLNQRVTEKLADSAFVSPPQARVPAAEAKPPPSVVSKAQKIISSTPSLQMAVSTPVAPVETPASNRPTMISQGTMTSPKPSPPESLQQKYNPSPIFRFPPRSDHNRSSSVPRAQVGSGSTSPNLGLGIDPNPSHSNTLPRNASSFLRPSSRQQSSSSRPSLEGGRPSNESIETVTRTKSVEPRIRPSSTYLESNMDYLREKEAASSRAGFLGRSSSHAKPSPEIAAAGDSDDEEVTIESNVDFLRRMEDDDGSRKKDRRSSSGNKQSKRSSLPSMSLAGTKTLLAGKFGDAFKRFETNTSGTPVPRTPSPLHSLERRDLTPIAGSEATDGRSDDGHVMSEDADDLPPEQRRELERRRLSMEERRVANAAAEYRKRLADRDAGGAPAPRSIGGVTRASTIQNKVKTLLDENQKPSPTKTAEGYGRFTDTVSASQARAFDDRQSVDRSQYQKPSVARKPVMPIANAPATLSNFNTNSQPAPINFSKVRAPAPTTSPNRTGPRPSAPPKPTHLNSLSTGPQSSPPKQTTLPSRPLQANPNMTDEEKEDYVADFSKRFPSLSGIEMVETEVPTSQSQMRSRDV